MKEAAPQNLWFCETASFMYKRYYLAASTPANNDDDQNNPDPGACSAKAAASAEAAKTSASAAGLHTGTAAIMTAAIVIEHMVDTSLLVYLLYTMRRGAAWFLVARANTAKRQHFFLDRWLKFT